VIWIDDGGVRMHRTRDFIRQNVERAP
jgi:hypothetical protein